MRAYLSSWRGDPSDGAEIRFEVQLEALPERARERESEREAVHVKTHPRTRVRPRTESRPSWNQIKVSTFDKSIQVHN